jgi:Dolichyl-phosphate-mannose-protein mannosyltransferase
VADKAYDNKSLTRASEASRVADTSSLSYRPTKQVASRRGIPEMDWSVKPVSYPPLLSGPAIAIYLACIKFLVHMLTAGNYGYYRDELYFLSAGERLDLGYVDFPPLVAIVTAVARGLLGDSPAALHFFPALASAAVVVLTALMARELGGGRFAQVLASLASLIAPNILVFGTWLSMDAFDQLFWALATYVLLLILKRDQPGLWLPFGLVAGLGLLAKVTMLFFGFAVFIALLLTPARRHLLTRWPWMGGALALAFLLPYIFWQITHGWPTLEFWANYEGKLAPDSTAKFIFEQVATMHPATLLIWPAGLYYYLLSKSGKPYQALGWIYLILFAVFALQNAKFYFLAPAYPILFAAGALTIERFIRWRQWNWLKPAYVSLLVISGAIVAPLAVVPVLPVDALAKITGTVDGNAGIDSEALGTSQVPQTFAFRQGWEEMAKTIARVHRDLTPAEQARSCILAGNFGEAGALEFFGPKYFLPRVISGHNNYYIWGTRGCSGSVIISVGVPLERLEAVFNDIEQEDMVTCEYCMPNENNLPVYIARDPKMPFKDAWPQFKRYN